MGLFTHIHVIINSDNTIRWCNFVKSCTWICSRTFKFQKNFFHDICRFNFIIHTPPPAKRNGISCHNRGIENHIWLYMYRNRTLWWGLLAWETRKYWGFYFIITASKRKFKLISNSQHQNSEALTSMTIRLKACWHSFHKPYNLT